MKENLKIIREQKELNQELALFFKQNGIKNFRITSLGNSIASGYSTIRTIKPLLLRNETIETIMNENGIDIEIHHFARAQNNNDEHIFEWLETNITESCMHGLNRSDYYGSKSSMIIHGLNMEKINEYYPTNSQNSIGLKDTIFETRDDLANVVIYNGCTGSFLDGISRGGSISQQLMHGFNRDILSLHAILKYIQSNNRTHSSDTQIYICGAPNYLGLGISEFLNIKLRSVCKQYPNTIYVEPIRSKFLYRSLEEDESLQKGFRKYKRYVDFHYDENEYLRFINNILKSLIGNYQLASSMTNIDREFYELSKKVEFSTIDSEDCIDVSETIFQIINEEYSKIESIKERKIFLRKLERYIVKRFPYDFYYLGKNQINSSIQKIKI